MSWGNTMYITLNFTLAFFPPFFFFSLNPFTSQTSELAPADLLNLRSSYNKQQTYQRRAEEEKEIENN